MAAVGSSPLSSVRPLRRTTVNWIFAIIYTSALLALFYRHLRQLLLIRSMALLPAAATLGLLAADTVLAFLWCATQSCRMFPIHRTEHIENIQDVLGREEEFPGLDVFVCTADPYKEPPIGVVNTAVSAMAYEYPARKLSVYISDDGGSQLTLFAFMEAARFAAHWLPFCRQNKVVERSPEAYFAAKQCTVADSSDKIKAMYEAMKERIENVLSEGKVGEELITGDGARQALRRWTLNFTRHNHPPVIQVLVDNSRDRDANGDPMPNLIYVSRGKSHTEPHNFKAGALNALVRVSAVMTNGPLILTLDCDMCSNDPGTVRRVLCYVADPNTDTSDLAYVQFPQMFRGLNRDDIYSCSFRWLFLINPVGMKKGPNYVGTGCFFRRRSLFGPPAMQVSPEIPELSVDHVVERPIQSRETVELAHRVAGSDYDKMTNWGSKVGFRYGSLVEDYYTGYLMQCEGWKSIFCNPDRPAFLGNVPSDLIGMLNQSRRWVVGSLEVTLSRYSVVTYGIRSSLGILMSLSYAQYSFWCLPAVPVTVYSFVPQLALINGSSLFPKASEPWFLLYLFLFLGAYGQDLAEYLLSGHGATFRRWWSEQRTWLIRSLTCFIFGTVDFLLKALGISNQGFNVTSKANHMEQTQMYDRGMFDFGATSPMYVSLSVAALVNLIGFARGLSLVLAMNQSAAVESFALQVLLAGFGVVNGWPLYEAMFLRNDKGKLPTKVTLSSAFLASLLCAAAAYVA